MSTQSSSMFHHATLEVMTALADPLKAPFCDLTYLLVLGGCLSRVDEALTRKDPLLPKVVSSALSFWALPLRDGQVYADLENKLFHQRCQCPQMHPGYLEGHAASQGFAHTFNLLFGDQDVHDLRGFAEAVAHFTDRLIYSIRMSRVPKSRAWQRQLKDHVDSDAEALVRSFTFWLSRSSHVYVFALFGTVLELSEFKMTVAMESYPPMRDMFDDRLHMLIGEKYAVAPLPSKTCPLDLVFHGAGCFAYALLTTLAPELTLPRFKTFLIPGAKQRYDDLISLLALLPQAGDNVRFGKAQDKIRIAKFAEMLTPLFKGTSSSLVDQIIKDLPEPPNGFTLFSSYFKCTDRCHNPLKHCMAHPEHAKDNFTVKVPVRVSKGQQLSACSKCKAVRYCSIECQKQDWKEGKPPHKILCPIFKTLFETDKKMGSLRLGDVTENIYAQSGINDADLHLAIGRVALVLSQFSEYKD